MCQCYVGGYEQSFAGRSIKFKDRTALSRSVCPDDEKWRRISRLRVQMADLERSSACPPWQSLAYFKAVTEDALGSNSVWRVGYWRFVV